MNKQERDQIEQYLRDHIGEIFPPGHYTGFGPTCSDAGGGRRRWINVRPGDTGCNGCGCLVRDWPENSRMLDVDCVGPVCFNCLWHCAKIQLVTLFDPARRAAARQFLLQYRGTILLEGTPFGPSPSSASGPRFRCDGCGGTYADHPNTVDSLLIPGAGRICISCLFLTAQLSLLNEENPMLVWGKDRRPRPPLTPEEERENAETRASLARAMEEWDNNQPWYKKLLGW